MLQLAPARFTGALYLKGNNANCLNYGASEQKADADYVQKVLPNATAFPTTARYFLACSATCSGRPGRLQPAGASPTTDCTGGMGAAAEAFDIPVPMPTLREK